MLIVTLAELGPENLFAAEKLTLVGVLLAVIWAIMTRRLVPGPFYEDLKRENEQLRRALEQWRETGNAIAGTAEELSKGPRPPVGRAAAKDPPACRRDPRPEGRRGPGE